MEEIILTRFKRLMKAVKRRDPAEQMALLRQIAAHQETIIKLLTQQTSDLMRVSGRELRRDLNEYLHTHQIGPMDTLRRVKTERLSLARYGDGEFRGILRYGPATGFQSGSAALAESLADVLALKGYDSEKLLVGIPGPLSGSPFWEAQWPEFWISLRHLLSEGSTFGDSYVSRPEFFTHFGKDAVAAWRDIWDGLAVWVVTGKGSRFENLDELFSGVTSMEFIHSTPRDAYSDLARLTAAVQSQVPLGGLVLVSLGPAGTVLAADLSRLGYWALDVGHISASLCNALGRASSPERMPIVAPARSSPRIVTVRGQSLAVQPTDRYAKFWDSYEGGTWETETFDVLARFLRPESRYVDIGGWIGPTVLYASALGAKVVCFEPDEVALAELRANVALNRSDRIEIVPAALARKSGRAVLRSNAFGNSESSLVATKVQRRSKVVDLAQAQDCATLAAKEAVRRYQFERADLIKIDIEGGEYPLLPVLIPALRGSRAPLFISFHAGNLGADQSDVARRDAVRAGSNLEMIRCLRRGGYELHRPDSAGAFKKVDWEQIVSEHSAKNWLWGSYLFFPAASH